MPKLIYTRNDVESLVDKLEARSHSVMLSDMPKLCADMRAAAKLLKFMVDVGLPVNPIEIDIGNNNGH